MKEKEIIIAIDSDPSFTKLLETSLSEHFTVFSGHNVKECINLIKEHKLDALLLDINMPDVDGYKLCKQFKNHQSTADLPIIFISELDGSEDATKGYLAGCDDFLFKPIEHHGQLVPKIKLLIQNRNRFRQLKQESKSNLAAAGKAMSDLASLNELYRQMLQRQTKDEVINLCFEHIAHFKLSLVCRITYGDQYFYYSNGKRVTELDKEVINTKEIKGQFADFGNRTLIRMGSIRLLLKNMPLYDFESHGYKKHYHHDAFDG